MNKPQSLSIGTSLLILLGSSSIHAMPDADPDSDREHAGHHHADSASLDLQLNNGQPWETDAPLRKGMMDMRQAFEARHAHHQARTLGPDGYAALANEVENRILYLFANCELPSDADAELHKLLASAMGSVRILRSETPRPGMHQLHEVLETYATYFDHPGWQEPAPD